MGILAIKFDDKISDFLCVSWLNKKSVMGIGSTKKVYGVGILGRTRMRWMGENGCGMNS